MTGGTGGTGGTDGVDDDPARLTPERLLAFSDGVVAIALTLLVLPLADLVPERVEPGRSGLSLLTENLPLSGSFLLSFAVIAQFWVAHHRLFGRVHHTSSALVWCNLAWLLTMVVLPFPTAMVGIYGGDPFTLRFYVGTLLASSLLLTTMTLLVVRTGLVAPGPEGRPAALATTILLLLVFVVVLVWPRAGYAPLFVLFASSLLEGLLARWFARP